MDDWDQGCISIISTLLFVTPSRRDADGEEDQGMDDWDQEALTSLPCLIML